MHNTRKRIIMVCAIISFVLLYVHLSTSDRLVASNKSADTVEELLKQSKAFFRLYVLENREDALELALMYATTAQEAEPDNPDVNVVAGLIYSEMRDNPFSGIKAIQCFEAAWEHLPDDPDLLSLLGFSYYREGQYLEALECFEEAFHNSHHIMSPSIIHAMTICYLMLDKAAAGSDYFGYLNRYHALTYINLAQVMLLKHQLRYEEAQELLTETLDYTIGTDGYSEQNWEFSKKLLKSLHALRDDIYDVGVRHSRGVL